VSSAASAIAWWTQYYASHDVVQLAAAGGHLVAIGYAASHALRGDRAALRLTSVSRGTFRPFNDDITTITRAHRHVIAGLTFALATGIAQLVAQLDYLPKSPVFWSKMLALVSLLANGRIIQVIGRELATVSMTGSAPAVNSYRLRNAAMRSIALWCAMILLGLLLTTVRP
jgi:hypothetical protein